MKFESNWLNNVTNTLEYFNRFYIKQIFTLSQYSSFKVKFKKFFFLNIDNMEKQIY